MYSEFIVVKNISDFHKLYAIINKEMFQIEINICIELPWLEPIHILMITQFVILQKQRECEISINASDEIKHYIKEIGLLDFISNNIEVSTTIEAVANYTAMPIRRLGTERMDEYIWKTIAYFRSFCKEKDIGMLETCIKELIMNAYDHSHSRIGAYIFCQYYSSENMIKMAVSDLGIGIPRAVNNYHLAKFLEPLTNKDCIKWALEDNKTTQSTPQNRGRGLNTVLSFVKANSGEIQLYSDDVEMIIGIKGEKFLNNPIYGFKGTSCQIHIYIDHLYNLEVEEETNWFD